MEAAIIFVAGEENQTGEKCKIFCDSEALVNASKGESGDTKDESRIERMRKIMGDRDIHITWTEAHPKNEEEKHIMNRELDEERGR